MTPIDVGRILTKAAAYDQRTVGEGDILAWLEVLGDLDIDDALAAVSRHYAESTDRLMPAHVRRIAGEIGRERRRLEAERWEAEQLAIGRGPTTDRSREILDAIRAMLPPGDPDKLRWGRRYWRQVQADWRRQQTAQPNPLFAGYPKAAVEAVDASEGSGVSPSADPPPVRGPAAAVVAPDGPPQRGPDSCARATCDRSTRQPFGTGYELDVWSMGRPLMRRFCCRLCAVGQVDDDGEQRHDHNCQAVEDDRAALSSEPTES